MSSIKQKSEYTVAWLTVLHIEPKGADHNVHSSI